MTTTTITNAAATITLRAGATLTVAGVNGGSASVVYTPPGGISTTVAVSGRVPKSFGPFPITVSFAITATGTAEAQTEFDAVQYQAILMQVDSLPTVGQPGVLYQTADATYWWDGDEFVPGGNGAAGSFTTLTASGLLRLTGVEAAITAFAGGGQADATALSATKNMHRIATCATAADSVKLPAATVGQVHFLRNDGAEAAQLFGTGTDTVNGAAAATGISVAAGSGLVAFCVEAGKWVTA